VLRLLVLAGLIIAAANCGADSPTRADRILAELRDSTGRVLVAAHRGDWRNFPENSLSAIRSAVEMGCDIIEIDVRPTRDGRFVVIHDKTLKRTTTGSGKVSHHTLAELKELRLLDGYGVPTDEQLPTLEEALEACRGKALVYLDKSENLIAEVVEIAERLGMERHVFVYGKRTAAELDADLGPISRRINYLPKLGDDTPRMAEYLRDFEGRTPAFVTSFADDSSPALAQFGAIREQGARVWASSLWPEICAGHTDDAAIDDPQAAWGWLIEKGASILCTDRPERLIEYLRTRE
jgi:glycerophosphoryl diester phosphodiesterase